MGVGNGSTVVAASFILAFSLAVFYEVTCQGGLLCFTDSEWSIPHTELWLFLGRVKGNATWNNEKEQNAQESQQNVTEREDLSAAVEYQSLDEALVTSKPEQQQLEEGVEEGNQRTSGSLAEQNKAEQVLGDGREPETDSDEALVSEDAGNSQGVAVLSEELVKDSSGLGGDSVAALPSFGGSFSPEGRFHPSSGFSLDSPAVEPPLPRRKHLLNLLDFGAVDDYGQALNTEAFEQAVAAAVDLAEDGGVQLTVPAGTWRTGCFNITSHFTLFLEAGATLVAQDEVEGWPILPPLPSYGQGREKGGPRYGSLIHGEHLQDVVITGQGGVIDGKGAFWWEAKRAGRLEHTRGCLIELQWSRDIIISNLALQDSPFWHVHLYDCHHVTVHGLRITADHKSPNTDGINPDSSTDVLIQECHISTGDDAIAIKSGLDQAGVTYGRPSRNVVVRNLQVEWTHGISIGSEMSGGVANVLVKNVTFVGPAATALRIKSSPGRGGYVTNVTFEDCHIGAAKYGVSIFSTYKRDTDTLMAATDPSIEGVLVMNVEGKKVQRAGLLEGLEGSPLRRVVLENVHLPIKAKAFTCSNAEVEARDVTPFPLKCFESPGGKRRKLAESFRTLLDVVRDGMSSRPEESSSEDLWATGPGLDYAD